MRFTRKRKLINRKHKSTKKYSLSRSKRGGGMWKTYKPSTSKTQGKGKKKSKISGLDAAYHQMIISPMARARGLSRL